MKNTFLHGLKTFCALCVLCGSIAFAEETQVQYLSGHGKDDAVPWKFFCTSGAKSGVWTNIPVPSQWDVLGFGTLSYKKDQANAWDERGLYEHEFSVAESWRGKRVFLVFDGVMTDTDAKLNGQSVGPVHQGSFYRFKYEVTSLVKFGATNKLEVAVSRHSANESVNKAERLADYYVYSGIFRPVYLQAVPQQFIERVAIDAKADGSFVIDVFGKDLPAPEQIDAKITTLTGEAVPESLWTRIDLRSNASVSSATSAPMLRLQTRINSPKLWTAETPNLYQAEVSIKNGGKIIHTITQRFGFRTMEVRDGDGLYVNGQKVILKGADRHSFWPDSGRCLSEAVHRLDINTLKDANMNAVRMSHYPPDEQFLDLCDELGLYVLDELAGWHNHYDNEIGPKLVREMVTRDVNHPCILFWDNGNEGGFNTNLDKLYGEYDPQQRRVLHPWATFSGVNTAHYLAFDKADIAARGQRVYFTGKDEAVDTIDQTKYIYMPTEFMHALYDGGGGAGLDDYWRMMLTHTNCAGGFIWALVDEGIKRPDTEQIDVAGNQAPDGLVGPYREREGSFYAVKEIWSPIQLRLLGQDDDEFRFKIENHFSFTKTRECTFICKMLKFAGPKEKGTMQEATRGFLPAPAFNKDYTELKFVRPAGNFDALALQVNDPSGRELWTWVWPIKKDESHRLSQEPAGERALVSATNGVITVKAGALTTLFSEKTGRIIGVERSGKKFSLANGPRLATQDSTLREITFTDDGPDALVSAKYDGELKSVLWRVHGNGWVQCTWSYAARGTNDFLGMVFDYPETLVTHKRWRGDGPFRVWQNRLRGVTPGVWENDYNDTIAGWRGWKYPEFKGFFANWDWLQLTTREGDITVLNQGETKFLQVLTPDFAPDNLKAKAFAPVPQCGLGFLDVIPPIGTKFKEAKFSGPQGQPAISPGEHQGIVSFYFGSLP